MTKFTPKPWKINGPSIVSGKYYFSMRQGSEDIKDRIYPDILLSGGWDGISYAERAANTILAAAAPDLLEACKIALQMCDDHLWGDTLESAIKKAEGK